MNVVSAPISQDLTVHVVRDLDALEALKPEWNAVHARDAQAGVFLSWDWMMQGFRANKGRFSVLVARGDGISDAIVGILPLKSRLHWSRSRSEFQTQYEAGGRLIWSEYTGFICDPDWEAETLPAFASALGQMPWMSFAMRYVDQTDRIKLFRKSFPKSAFSTALKPYLINKGQTNNLVSPQVALPTDFDQFLKSALSANSRQKFRRTERKHLETGDLHLTGTSSATIEAHLGILLKFWMTKWEPLKGRSAAAKTAGNYRKIVEAAFATNTLFLPVLWRGDRPIGALAHILDRKLKKVHFIVVGRDLEFDAPYVGQILHLGSIEWAIAHGYRVYDFSHGNEPYKYSYGTTDVETQFLTVQRRTADRGTVFDDANTTEAVARIQTFIKAKKYDRAVQGCEQIVATLNADT